MKTILISTIGDTDPVRNGFDGPLVHIARQYKPEKIYLLLTEKMYKLHIENNLYGKCLDDLYYGIKNAPDECYQGHKINYTLIPIRLNIEDASNFEAFRCFGSIIDKIYEENGSSTNYIANISSGSPQMITAMCLDIVVNNRNALPVQVKTPQKDSNAGIPHYNKDMPDAILNDFDSFEDTRSNRCNTVELFTFRDSSCFLRLKSFIYDYNYSYALKLLNNEKSFTSNKLVELCKIGYYYTESNIFEAKKLCNTNSIYFNQSSETALLQIINAYNILWTKDKLGQFTDFARALTPIFYLVSKKIVAGVFNINEITVTKNGVSYLSENKLRTHVLGTKYNISYDVPLSSRYLIMAYAEYGKNEDITKLFEYVRNIEEQIRNKVAHEVTYISKEGFKQLCNTTPSDVLAALRKLIDYAYKDSIKQKDYTFINDINIHIEKELDFLMKR